MVYDVVIVGGGIAAVEAVRHFTTKEYELKIAFVSGGDFVQAITSIDPISGTLFDFKLDHISVRQSLNTKNSKNVDIFPIRAQKINPNTKCVTLTDGIELQFEKILLCTGASPKNAGFESPHCLSLRDTASALELSSRMKNAKRVVIVGNGGIALELVHSLKDVEIFWCARDRFGRKFLDEAALKFILTSKQEKTKKKDRNEDYICAEFKQSESVIKNVATGAALGPNWFKQKELNLVGTSEGNIKFVSPVYVVSVINTDDSDYPVLVKLSNGEEIYASFCVFGIGVKSETDLVSDFAQLGEEKGVLVDKNMRSINVPWLYAAGDCCSVHEWPNEETENWMQMRLWSQARIMGQYAAKSILNNIFDIENYLDYSFANFAHSTSFFGFRVILLGLFNGQGLVDSECEYLLRITEDEEYIKAIIHGDKVRGAALIFRDECDLEEVLENLICNQFPLGDLKDQLLDPNVDVGDYFD